MRVVIPSVNYADFLSLTLPAWLEVLPVKPFIVTAPSDRETALVAYECECPVIYTSAWKEKGAVFNKARALNQAFGFEVFSCSEPAEGELCLSLDADVYPFGSVDWDSLVPGVMYSVQRLSCVSIDELEAHRNGALPKEHFPEIKVWRHHRVRDPAGLQGYFQCWRYRPGDTFGSYPTAARYDVDFGGRFEDRRYIESMYVLHLGEHRKNWSGRVTPPWNGKAIHEELASPEG